MFTEYKLVLVSCLGAQSPEAVQAINDGFMPFGEPLRVRGSPRELYQVFVKGEQGSSESTELDYKVLFALDRAALSAQVNDAIAEGYQPFGSPVYIEGSPCELSQSMYRGPLPGGGSGGEVDWSSIPAGTTVMLGGIKLGSDAPQTTAAAGVTNTASRTYAIQLNSAGQAVVNVPWVNTTYTLGTASDSVLGGVKLGSATVQNVAAAAVSATASRSYAVQVNSTGNMVVNVPWTDSNTTYQAATTTTAGLMSAGDKSKLDGIDAASIESRLAALEGAV